MAVKGETLNVLELPPEVRGKEEGLREKVKDLKDMARGSIEAVEKRAIMDALTKTWGNVTQAARVLGISRVTLQKKMKAYNLHNASR